MDSSMFRGVDETLITIVIILLVVFSIISFVIGRAGKAERYKAVDKSMYQPCIEQGYTKKRCDFLVSEALLLKAE